MAGGGYRAMNRVNRGGSDCASLIYCRGCIEAILKADFQDAYTSVSEALMW
jgi:hypothetical protein